MKKTLLIFLIMLLILIIGALIVAYSVTEDMRLTENIDLIIEEGSGAAHIAGQLEDAGLVKNRFVFRLFARRHGIDSQFKAGRYVFASGDWSLEAVSEFLLAGGEDVGNAKRVTIREGLTVAQTAQILADAGFGDVSAYMDYAANGDFSRYPFIPPAGSIPIPGNRLDGFLFPDTYMIDLGWTEQQIFDMLLDQFVYVWESNGFDVRAKESGLSIYEATTMASLVEKEAQVEQDRPIIAGVFYKRLELGWNLESCATVQFILGEPKIGLTYADIAIDNPYNCYLYPGLPPGPIAAPGLAALRAALYPTESEYLYFKARLDGSHRFSKTLAEHESNQEGDQ